MAKITLDQLIDIAFSVEEGDPVDWGTFTAGKEHALAAIGASVLEQFDKDLSDDQHRLIVMAAMTKLIVENMVLHRRLLEGEPK